MIVVDTSALIAIARAEPDARRCMEALHGADDVRMSAATLAETRIVAFGRGCEKPMTALLDDFGLVVEPLTEARAHAASQAYQRYGKGFHAAALNLGDVFAYALARELSCPLLFIGNDFARTDVAPALA